MTGRLKPYKADLHIHTVLSPCADLEMSPANIIKQAKLKDLSIIGISDHNSTRNAKVVQVLGKKEGILVLTGAEVTTKEEVHCLAFFEKEEELDAFQHYLDEHGSKIPNQESYFGYQPVVDANDAILEMLPYYLPAALKKGIHEVQRFVHSLNGLFIPAHVNRSAFGIFSQLGFIPADLIVDALGINGNASEKHVRKHYVIENNITVICNSDAHVLAQIGTAYSSFYLTELSFGEVKLALNQIDNRYVKINENNL